jgi:DNA polymerase III subunit epsilon
MAAQQGNHMTAIKTILEAMPAGRHIVLDTETTGFTPKGGHRIVEIAAVEIIDGRLTGRSFHRYCNPGRHVPKVASDVHGLTDAFLADKPRFRQILPELVAFLGAPDAPIWAHSAPFDKRFVEAEFAWANTECSHRFECSMKLAKKLPLGLPNAKLETLAAAAKYQWKGRGAHSAIEDTYALASVLTDLLWPTAVTTPVKSAAKSAKPAKRKTSSKASISKAREPKTAVAPVAVALPEGFVPLRPAEDARICRHDGIVTEGRLFARGIRWTQDEAQSLVDRFLKEGADFDRLVSLHGRTPAALMLKLEGLGVIAGDHPYARAA